MSAAPGRFGDCEHVSFHASLRRAALPQLGEEAALGAAAQPIPFPEAP